MTIFSFYGYSRVHSIRFVIRSARPDSVRGTGVADERVWGASLREYLLPTLYVRNMFLQTKTS